MTAIFASIVAADPGALPFLGELVVIFAAAAGLAFLCHRVRLIPIVGYLLAGVLLGPHALGLVESVELVEAAAEVGVILLLFTIGLEFSLEKLARIRRYIVVGGALQVGLTTLAAAGVLTALGVGWRAGIYTGFLLALSSTAIVLKLLAQRGAVDSPAGRISLGILIFQDLAIVGMALGVPVLAARGGSPGDLLRAVGLAAVIIVAVLLLAGRIVPPLLERVARTRSPEVFLLSVVVVCFGIAWIASLGGVSLALGAFLAGLVVSGSRFREHAVAEILPLRTVFNALFFVAVGMLLDLRVVAEHPGLVLGSAAAVLVVKIGITAGTVRILGYPLPLAVGVGIWLGQIGEFSLVLAEIGRNAGLSPAGLGNTGEQVFLGVVVLLMIATPFGVQGEPRLRRWLERRASGPAGEAPAGGVAPPGGHVVVGGYGLAGREVEEVLKTFGIPYVVVDLNPVSVMEADARGVPILFGDLTNAHTLEQARIATADLVVLAINDPEAARRVVRRIKLDHPHLDLIVRAPYLIDVRTLKAAGADVVVTGELEASLTLVREVLAALGVHRTETATQVARLRAALEVEERSRKRGGSADSPP